MMKFTKNYYLILLSILLINLSWPPFDMTFLIYISLIPFLEVILNSKHKFKDGFFFGALLASTICYSFLFIYGKSLIFRISIFLLLMFVGGTLFAIYSILIGIVNDKIKNRGLRNLMLALTWVVIEFVSGKVLVGFTYNHYVPAHKDFFLLQFTKLFGAYFISLFTVFINYQIITIIRLAVEKKPRLFKKNLISLVIITVLIVFFQNYLHIKTDHTTTVNTDNLKICLIQGNITSYEYEIAKNSVELKKNNLTKYINLSKEAIKEYHPDLIVWPETAVHFWIMRLPMYRDQIYKIASENSTNLLVGVPDLDENGKEYNAAFLISSDGSCIGRINKEKLVPFMEGFFSKGSKRDYFELTPFKFGVGICYESLFPKVATSYFKYAILDAMFYISNNGMLGYTNAPYISAAYAVFRATENNIFVFQVMNTGITRVISPSGEIIIDTPLFEESIVFFALPKLSNDKTIYSQYGEIIYWLISVVVIVVFLYLIFYEDNIIHTSKRTCNCK